AEAAFIRSRRTQATQGGKHIGQQHLLAKARRAPVAVFKETNVEIANSAHLRSVCGVKYRGFGDAGGVGEVRSETTIPDTARQVHRRPQPHTLVTVNGLDELPVGLA